MNKEESKIMKKIGQRHAESPMHEPIFCENCVRETYWDTINLVFKKIRKLSKIPIKMDNGFEPAENILMISEPRFNELEKELLK